MREFLLVDGNGREHFLNAASPHDAVAAAYILLLRAASREGALFLADHGDPFISLTLNPNQPGA